jgi:hypothetical protein
MGATLMDGLDTLLLAGLDAEVHEAELWLASHFDVNSGRVRGLTRQLWLACELGTRCMHRRTDAPT